MVLRELSLHLVLGHFLISHVGSTCIPVKCLRCNVTGEARADSCGLCLNITHCFNGTLTDIPQNCMRDFKVSVNTSGSKVEEGHDIALTCVHNLPDVNVTFKWNKNGKEIECEIKSVLILKRVHSRDAGKYICSVESLCGVYKSLPHGVTVPNRTVVTLVICMVSALVLVFIMGLAMKFKLKRDNLKHRERMQQRAQIGQSGGPTPFTPRDS